MLRQRYDTPEARSLAGQIAEQMRDAAYRASSELARERGAFPLFNADLYLSGTSFATRLPDDLKERIRKHGLRNSRITSYNVCYTKLLRTKRGSPYGASPMILYSSP